MLLPTRGNCSRHCPVVSKVLVMLALGHIGFKTKSHFVVETDYEEIYVLDLSGGEDWKPLGREIPKADGYFVVGVNDDFFFSLWAVFMMVKMSNCRSNGPDRCLRNVGETGTIHIFQASHS